jgi:hypothetical protein
MRELLLETLRDLDGELGDDPLQRQRGRPIFPGQELGDAQGMVVDPRLVRVIDRFVPPG